MIKKVRQHINQNEPLIFENSSPGKRGYQLPTLDVPPVDAAKALGAQNTRRERYSSIRSIAFWMNSQSLSFTCTVLTFIITCRVASFRSSFHYTCR